MHEHDLIKPIRIEFAGRDATGHRSDAVMLGQSLSGIGKVYNSIGHYHFGREIQNSSHAITRTQVGPPERGSIFYLIYLTMVHGQLALFPQLLFEFAELAVPAYLKAMVAKRTGQNAQLDKALEIIEAQNATVEKLALGQQEAAQFNQGRLMDIIDNLISVNHTSMAEMAAPVGKTVKELRHLPEKAEPITIDEPTAEALRSGEDVTVGDTMSVAGTLHMLSTRTGTFGLEPLAGGKAIRGKITDPALALPENVYSHALDTKQPIVLTGKPTIRDKQLQQLFVSDAKPE